MKTNVKKIALLLCLSLCVPFFAFTVFGAAEDTNDPDTLFIQGNWYKESHLETDISGACWSWDAQSKTITLDGITCPQIIYCGGDVTINCVGENSVLSDTKDNLISAEGNLTVTGSGSLKVVSANAGSYSAVRSKSGSVVISLDGTFDVSSTNGCCIGATNGGVSFAGKGEVKLKAKGADYNCVYAGGDVVIGGSGDFTAVSDDVCIWLHGSSYGLKLEGSAGCITLEAGDGFRAVNRTVGGSRLDDYTAEGSPSSSSVRYTLKPAHTCIRGDFNDDGEVNTADAIYLLRHTMRQSKYPVSQNGDVNGDGVCNSSDAIYLLRYTMRPGKYPLAGNAG